MIERISTQMEIISFQLMEYKKDTFIIIYKNSEKRALSGVRDFFHITNTLHIVRETS
jgi:hypothetical protein